MSWKHSKKNASKWSHLVLLPVCDILSEEYQRCNISAKVGVGKTGIQGRLGGIGDKNCI